MESMGFIHAIGLTLPIEFIARETQEDIEKGLISTKVAF